MNVMIDGLLILRITKLHHEVMIKLFPFSFFKNKKTLETALVPSASIS